MWIQTSRSLIGGHVQKSTPAVSIVPIAKRTIACTNGVGRRRYHLHALYQNAALQAR